MKDRVSNPHLKELQKSEDLPFRVLNPHEAEQFYKVRLYAPPSNLDAYVQLLWVMRWDLQESSFPAEVVPSAYTNLTCMPEGARVTGVTRGLYPYQVEGKGTIFGVMFKPGGLFPFIKTPIRDLTDNSIPAEKNFPELTGAFNCQVLQSDDQTDHDFRCAKVSCVNPRSNIVYP